MWRMLEVSFLYLRRIFEETFRDSAKRFTPEIKERILHTTYL